ncbi:class I SAM-dependent methyltransferase [Candidatus Pseudothioglobus singularis]|nr:class I SAM-dependent methyltransferase [Candidatus Pseudothioglobus singularis]
MNINSSTASQIQSKSDRSKHYIFIRFPGPIKKFIKFFYFLFMDLIYYFSRDKGSMIPPPSNSGMKNYLEIGKEFFNYFLDYAELKPNAKVLDIGCATGRMALPLTKYLSKEGSYEGFDIKRKQIDWAKQNISSKFPNFNFQKVNVVNPIYSNEGEKAEGFVFPYKDNTFDFVFLTSVFTHMLPKDIESYLSEIKRVLVSEGKCFATFFLLNDESKRLIENGASEINFKYQIGECLTDNPDAPEEAIAYEEDNVLTMLDSQNFKLIDSIKFGSWPGREEYLSFQDIIVFINK